MFFGDDDDNSGSSDSGSDSGGSDSSDASSNSANDNSAEDQSASTQSAGDAGSDVSGDFTVNTSVETARGSADQPDSSPQIDLTVNDMNDNSGTVPPDDSTSSSVQSNQNDQGSANSDFEVSSGAEPSTAHVDPDLDSSSSSSSSQTTMRASDGRDGSDDSDRSEEQHDEERNITEEKQESDAAAQQEETPEAP
jgi:hypothetical protein